MQLADKVAIITGAGSGIGQATAVRFAAEGARIGVADVNLAAAQAVVDEIAGAGGHALAIEVDVAVPASAEAAVQAAVDEFGTLDILINNAGVNRDGFMSKLTEEQWDTVLDVNLKGTFLMSQAAMKVFAEKGAGRIVSTASIAVRGNYGQVNYAASKAGIIGFTRSLALEAARFGVRVNCISPGPTLTPMAASVPDKIKETMISRVPLKRMADPAEIAAMHVFLASDEASFVTGQHIYCDGGISIGVVV